ncbi:hypothetical protein [Fibrivirga algicola]|uniref:Uncharacterized protein n=1 Tax=Fibrivirga algicola TaxID=2950420 RepID=A0ABX0QCP5_9BACT|nr:hypothetical protein [Fibrivirga algicola]NID09747.1 hypothetical protein [Fibrivirga algicola]
MTDNEMVDLRDAIRKKYEGYRFAKPGKYPPIKFNSYPAPYEYLRTSFKEELLSQGQAEMKEALTTIPSIKTFAKIFHDGYVLKDEKAITTCCLYAWGSPTPPTTESSHTITTATSTTPLVPSYTDKPAAPTVSWILRNKAWLAGIVLSAAAAVYAARPFFARMSPPSDLLIDDPLHGKIVSREVLAVGRVSNARKVWIVVRAVGGRRYWVQRPIDVNDDHSWRGVIYIGSSDKADIGVHSQIRAFVNPIHELAEEQVLYAWPEAELSTPVVEVVRGLSNE